MKSDFKHNIKQISKKGILFVTFFSFLVLSCSTKPVMSELVNSRMKVVLKGTYLSNGTETRQTTLKAFKYSGLSGVASNNTDSESFKLYLDIAELRLGSGSGPGKKPTEYWQYFTDERIVMCDDIVSFEGRTLESCKEQNGKKKLNDFLTGSGVSMKAVDVEAKTYNHLALYFRKFVSSPSFDYNSSGAKIKDRKATFDNQIVYGVNAGGFYYFAPNDDAKDTPRLFPLQNKNLSLSIPDNDKPYVLEVRMLFNNTLMKHIKEKSGEYISFIGPSDWLRGQYDKSGKLGGNFALTARVYQPSTAGSITGSGLIAVMPAGFSFDATNVLPIAAANGTITNLAPGSYDVYKIVIDNATGFASGSSSPCATSIEVQAGKTTASGC